jgi:hypothetical protein
MVNMIAFIKNKLFQSLKTIKNRYYILFFIIVSFIFSYTILPLYGEGSDQNLYNLYGLAKAGAGFLTSDWLVQTGAHYPVYDVLIYNTSRFFSISFSYIYIAIFMSIYIYCLLRSPSKLFKVKIESLEFMLAAFILIIIHSGPLNNLFLTKGWFLLDNFYYGLGGQYLINQYFQPSSFDVFLLLSLYLYQVNKVYPAIICLAIAVTFHPPILLIAVFLMTAYLIISFMKNRNINEIFKMILTIIAFLIPIVIIMGYILFKNIVPIEILKEGAQILINTRASEHMDASRFLSLSGIIKMLIMVCATWIVRRTKLFWLMTILLFLGLFLTVLQIISHSSFLSFLSPWRVFALLTPLGTAIIAFYLSTNIINIIKLSKIKKEGFLKKTLIILFLFSSFLGISHMRYKFSYEPKYVSKNIIQVMDFVKKNKKAGDIYLIPIHLKKFRIYTEAPIFVDFKGFPFGSRAAIEWFKRIKLAKIFYEEKAPEKNIALEKIIINYDITHVLISANSSLSEKYFTMLFNNEEYKLYKKNW